MLEDVLTTDFIRLGRKSTHFCVQLRVLASVHLTSKQGLQVDILVPQVFEVLLGLLELLSGLSIHLSSHVEVQVDQPPFIVFELVESGIDSLLCSFQLVVELLGPFSQNPQDGSVMRLEDGAFDLFLTK